MSGFDHLSPLKDAGIVTNLLRDEPGIDVTVIHCTRFGKYSTNANRSSLLLVTLSSDDDARAAMCTAKTLSTSTYDYVHSHIFLNAD